jgi:simple sugar transport system substrate-binding protein
MLLVGIGRAIEEAGLQGKVCLVGTGLPNPSAQYPESGAITAIGFWDPRDAGMAMNVVAKLLLEKKPLTDGMNPGVKGYEKMTVRGVPERGYSSSATRW